MDLTKEAVREALATVRHPTSGLDLNAGGFVRRVACCDGLVSIALAGGELKPSHRQALAEAASAAVRAHAHKLGAELKDVHVDITNDRPPETLPGAPGGTAGGAPSGTRPGQPAPPVQANALPNVRHIIAVGAGKGGVGKSTVAVNLAVGLARRGHAVGILDGDIYGPSLPTMLGLDSLEATVLGGMIQPFLVHGVKAVTIGKLVDPERPLVWRGPMAHGAFKQLADQTSWGELDYLVIDLPPGTGDVSLTMAQTLKVSGAVVVCTPQRVAQDDAVRAARMFQQLNIDILGVVENMSYFIGDDGKEYDIFGRGGAEKMAQRLGVPFLGAIPITMALRENSDLGNPTANFTDRSARNRSLAQDLERLVTNLEGQAALASIRSGAQTPSLTIS